MSPALTTIEILIISFIISQKKRISTTLNLITIATAAYTALNLITIMGHLLNVMMTSLITAFKSAFNLTK
jgi:hypothetical protein